MAAVLECEPMTESDTQPPYFSPLIGTDMDEPKVFSLIGGPMDGLQVSGPEASPRFWQGETYQRGIDLSYEMEEVDLAEDIINEIIATPKTGKKRIDPGEYIASETWDWHYGSSTIPQALVVYRLGGDGNLHYESMTKYNVVN